MTYSQLVDWIIRQDELVQRLYYWASQTVKMFWYPEHFTVERIIERLGGLHISSENDDYSFQDAAWDMDNNDAMAFIAITKSGQSYNRTVIINEVDMIIRNLYGDSVLYGTEYFIGYLCLAELYKEFYLG